MSFHAVVVCTFSAVDQWPTLNCHATSVIHDAFVSHNSAWLHVKIECNHIAFLHIIDTDITLFYLFCIAVFAVYSNAPTVFLSVSKAVKATRGDLTACPTRYANQQRCILISVSFNANRHLSIPRIVGFCFYFHLFSTHFHVGFTTHEEVHINVIASYSIDISGHRRNETAEVTGTTSTAKPRLTRRSSVGIELVNAVGRKRIRIEEASAINAHATDNTII